MNKRFWISLLYSVLIFLVASSVLFNFKDKNKDTSLEEITLAEVAHTIFYAPQYVAIEKGYFEENDIDIDLILTSGADKVTAALLSGDAQIGLSGSEATIYVYNGGEKDYLKTFAQLTQKDGSFIVSRRKEKNFTLDNLKGKTIGGASVSEKQQEVAELVQQNKDSIASYDTKIAKAESLAAEYEKKISERQSELAALEEKQEEEKRKAEEAKKAEEERFSFIPCSYDKILNAYDDLRLGRADAVISDTLVAIDYLTAENSEFKQVWKGVSDDYFGICAKKGNKVLVEKINSIIEEMKADGTMKALYEKVFKMDLSDSIK